nr:hypothetical protein [Tanacetum cinerariifolium]
MSNDEERSDLIPNRYDTPSPHFGSTFEPPNEKEGGNSQGLNAVSSEDVRSANPEDNHNVVSEGDDSLIHPHGDVHQDIIDTHNLRSFEPKSFLEASKHYPWVDAMNSETDALY